MHPRFLKIIVTHFCSQPKAYILQETILASQQVQAVYTLMGRGSFEAVVDSGNTSVHKSEEIKVTRAQCL